MTRSIAALAAASLLAIPASARAERRYYGETYNAVTAPKGELELEVWTTYYEPPSEATGAQSLWRHQLEVETGLTDRWDVAAYGVVRQIQGSDPELEAVKLETRYALATPGTWLVDPVLYLEVQKTLVDERPLAIEEKLIVGKDLGPLNLSLNVASEQEFEAGKTDVEWEWAFGSSWEIVPAIRLGAEAFGSVAAQEVSPGVERTEAPAWAGPAVSIAFGRAWLVLAAGFGLSGESDAVRARAILSFEL